MTKRLITSTILMLALMCATAAFAQTTGGIKAGVNFAKVSASDDIDDITENRIGAIAGGFLTVGVGSVFSIQPEVLVSMQGSKFTFGTAKVDYVQVPVLLRIGSSPKSHASVYGMVGPSFGILLRDEGLEDDLERIDVGVAVAAGFTVSRLLVEARYTAGLVDFSKGAVAYKHRVFSLLGGFRF